MQYKLKTNLQSVKLDHRKMDFNLKMMKKDREDQIKRVKVRSIYIKLISIGALRRDTPKIKLKRIINSIISQ